MKINKKVFIEYVKKNGIMNNPYLMLLLHEGQISKNFTSMIGGKDGCSVINYKKLEKLTDNDVIGLLNNNDLELLATTISEEENIKTQKKSGCFIPTDILNKNIINIVNGNYHDEKNISYNVVKEYDCNKRFVYFDLLVLRAIYNFYDQGIITFTTCQIYNQLFQCYGETKFIKEQVKEKINDSLMFLMSIMLDIEFKDNSYIIRGHLLPIITKKTNVKGNNKYMLFDNPVLYNFAKSKKHFFYDSLGIYKFNLGQRCINKLVLYTKVLDFIYSLHRSKKPVMRINFTTIFNDCGFEVNSRSQKKKLIDSIKEYLDFFRKNYLLIDYKIIEEKHGFKMIEVYSMHCVSSRKSNPAHTAVKVCKNEIENALQHKKEQSIEENDCYDIYHQIVDNLITEEF